MAAFIIPPTPPFSVPAGTVWPNDPTSYVFSPDMGASYIVMAADVRPPGALSNAFLAAYGLTRGRVRPA